MAIINLTQKNFSKAAAERIDEMGMEGILASALLGGREKMKEAIADIPDENLLWVNTDHVAAASGPTKIRETGDIVFRIYFDHPDSKNTPVWIKGEDYKRFILEWAGEANGVGEGLHKVPDGCQATVLEDMGETWVKVVKGRKEE